MCLSPHFPSPRAAGEGLGEGDIVQRTQLRACKLRLQRAPRSIWGGGTVPLPSAAPTPSPAARGEGWRDVLTRALVVPMMRVADWIRR